MESKHYAILHELYTFKPDFDINKIIDNIDNTSFLLDVAKVRPDLLLQIHLTRMSIKPYITTNELSSCVTHYVRNTSMCTLLEILPIEKYSDSTFDWDRENFGDDILFHLLIQEDYSKGMVRRCVMKCIYNNIDYLSEIDISLIDEDYFLNSLASHMGTIVMNNNIIMENFPKRKLNSVIKKYEKKEQTKKIINNW